jgi:hypothetical protein
MTFRFSVSSEWLEILEEGVRRVAMLFNPKTAPAGRSAYLRQAEAVATSFAVQVFATLPAQQTRSTAASGKWGLSQQVRNRAQALALPPKGGDSVKLTHRVSKCYLITAIGHCVSACERT